MKTIIVNGSPRKNRNTAQILKAAQKGAESIGEQVEYFDLFDLSYRGCRSCLTCKRKDIAEPCKCYYKDELSPVLEKILSADRLIIGSPIYYGEPTGAVRDLLERTAFPAMSYNSYSSTFSGKTDVEVFLTMNVDADNYPAMYGKKMEEYFAPLRFLNGSIRITPVCDTLQVSDYSKYEMARFSETHKKAVHDKFFPLALESAFNIGCRKAE